MSDKETLYSIALTRLSRLNNLIKKQLLEDLGSATAIYENRADIRQVLPDASQALCETISSMDAQISRAEQELEYAEKNHISCLTLNDSKYPARLRECPDAPIVLYYMGDANLNATHIISIVGTRKITEYGKDLCRNFISDLKQLCPDAIIVSGLAYGVDIHAHRNALEQGMQTIGVLAHGLDQIYPRLHRDTAVKMVSQGGLLTEYISGTSIDKMNFVARNRIVAGISDATIVVESAYKGGSLITANIARDYSRDVFTFPGRVTDKMSEGCNQLLGNLTACPVLSAEDFMISMKWESPKEQEKQRNLGIQRNLFPELTDDESRIIENLQKCDEKLVNQICVETGIPIGQLNSLLFGLEMKGVIKMMAGGLYRLL